jgi:hypothetical protein
MICFFSLTYHVFNEHTMFIFNIVCSCNVLYIDIGFVYVTTTDTGAVYVR